MPKAKSNKGFKPLAENNTWIIPVAPGTRVTIVPSAKPRVTLGHLPGEPYEPIQVKDKQIREAAVRSGVYRYATADEIKSKEADDEL